MVQPPEPTPSRPALRRLLGAVLVTASDLDAFCLDFFPAVHRRFDGGMDRVSKLNLLLALVEAEELLARLREAHPQEVANHHGSLQQQTALPLLEQREQELAAQLARLLAEREVLRRYRADTREVDEAIDAAQRALRRGPHLNSGEVLAERFQLIKVLGEGTFADVWEARNLRPDGEVPETVAVKTLHGNQSRDASRRERFAQGAQQMRALLHRHIVRVYSEAAEYQGFHYFAMEYLAGGDLSRAVARDRQGKGRRQWLRAVLQVGEALTCAHERGLVHRDVKPQNILLDEQGSARLSDFDLVMGGQRQRLTRTQMGLGTLSYAAPEQLRDAAHVDERADVYGLGRTALFVLYRQELPDEALEHRQQFLRGLGLAEGLGAVLERATAWSPEARYASAASFCAALTAALDGGGGEIRAAAQQPAFPTSANAQADPASSEIIPQSANSASPEVSPQSVHPERSGGESEGVVPRAGSFDFGLWEWVGAILLTLLSVILLSLLVYSCDSCRHR